MSIFLLVVLYILPLRAGKGSSWNLVTKFNKHFHPLLPWSFVCSIWLSCYLSSHGVCFLRLLWLCMHLVFMLSPWLLNSILLDSSLLLWNVIFVAIRVPHDLFSFHSRMDAQWFMAPWSCTCWSLSLEGFWLSPYKDQVYPLCLNPAVWFPY
jgi:hypothetical protein